MQSFYGITDLVFATHPHLKDQSSLVLAMESDGLINVKQEDNEILDGVRTVFGESNTNPADYLYIFDEIDSEVDKGVVDK